MVVISFKPYEIRILANIMVKPDSIELYKFDLALILDKFYRGFNKRIDKSGIKIISEEFFKKYNFVLPTTYKK